MKNKTISFSAYYEFDPLPRRITMKESKGKVLDKIIMQSNTYYLVQLGITAWIVSPGDIETIE